MASPSAEPEAKGAEAVSEARPSSQAPRTIKPNSRAPRKWKGVGSKNMTRKSGSRVEAEQQKQADAFRRETLWLALDLRGAFTEIGKSLHPRVFGAFFGWRQQYLAAKQARS